MKQTNSATKLAAILLIIIAAVTAVTIFKKNETVDKPIVNRQSSESQISPSRDNLSRHKSEIADASNLSNGSPRHIPGAIDSKIYHFDPPRGQYRLLLPGLVDSASKGDASSAYTLSRLLLDCYLTGQHKPSGLGSEEEGRCDGVRADSPKDGLRWLTRAADQGFAPARILYPDLVSQIMTPSDMIRDPAMVQDYKERAISYLTSVANEGSEGAMLSLSNAYYNGILVNKDLEMAYAYRYAADMINPSNSSDDPADIYGGNLSEEEKNRAKLIARDIYNKCCG
jgi:TPR repeat protein